MCTIYYLEMLQIAFKVFLIFTFLEPLLWYWDPPLGTGSTPFGTRFPAYVSLVESLLHFMTIHKIRHTPHGTLVTGQTLKS